MQPINQVDSGTPSLRRRSPRKLNRLRPQGLRPVVLGLLLFFSLGTWAVGSSVGSSPDDQVHMASIWCQSFSGESCEVVEETGERLIPAPLIEAMCTTQNPFQSAGCQPFLNLNDPPMRAVTDVNTRQGLYPPGFYATLNLFVQTDIEKAIVSMRLFNAFIFSALFVLLRFFLPPRMSQALTWSLLITLIPLGFFLVPSVNPSSWAITSIGFGWLALLGFLEAERRKAIPLGIIYVITAVMAVSSRTDSAVFFIATSALAIFLSPVGFRSLLPRLWLPLILPLGGLLVLLTRGIDAVGQLGVAFEGMGRRSVARYGEPLPWAKGASAEPTDEFDWNLLWNNIWDAPALWLGFVGGYPFGSLGWLDTLLPQFVPFSLMFVIAAITFAGMRKSRLKRQIALIAIIVSSWALPVYILQLGGFIVGEQFQPRYLLPIFMVAVGVAILQERGTPPLNWSKFQVFALWLPLVTAHSIALHTGIRRYTTGFGLGGWDLDASREWWWLFMPQFMSANAVWIIGSSVFAILAALVLFEGPLRLRSGGRRPDSLGKLFTGAKQMLSNATQQKPNKNPESVSRRTPTIE